MPSGWSITRDPTVHLKRYVRTLAVGSIVGFQSLPGYVSVAAAQIAQLPPVEVTGPSSGGSSGGGSQLPPGSGYSGGGGCQSCGGYPEGEFGASTPAPAPAPGQESLAAAVEIAKGLPLQCPKPAEPDLAYIERSFKYCTDTVTKAFPVASRSWAPLPVTACNTAGIKQKAAMVLNGVESCT